MELFKTYRGNDACNFNGYSYRVDKCSNILKRWRCAKSGCKGKLWTLPDNTNPEERGTHDHLQNPEENLIKATISNMKERARNETIPLTVVHQDAEKTRWVYTEIFRQLKDLATDMNLNLSPNLVTIDFESGLIPALQAEFPMARLRGCYFHYCQAVYRKVQNLGFSEQYAQNDLIRSNIRLLLALAFAPRDMIREAYDLIKDEAPLLLRPLFTYFEDQWLTQVNLEMWNMYGIRRRTNNDVEGWHLKFKNLVGKHHPNIYDFITKAIKEQALTETILAQISAGQNVIRRNKKYVEIDKRIRTLQQRFDDGEINIITYLRGVSYNLSSPIAF